MSGGQGEQGQPARRSPPLSHRIATAAAATSPLRALLGEEGARRFRQDRAARLGIALAVAAILFAALGPLVTPHSPLTSDFTLARDVAGAPPGPSAAHWLGTDAIFRDLLARLASGGRVSLTVAFAATALSTAMGAVAGIVAGMSAGTRLEALDGALLGLVDVVLALPYLLVVTAIGIAVGRAEMGTLTLVLGLTSWTLTARLVRARTMEVTRQDFVEAARALGAGPLHVVRRHVLPNVAGTLATLGSFGVGQMILAEAALGYLGVGVSPPTPTWGRMLFEAEPSLAVRPFLGAAPALAILLNVLAWNRIGAGLQRALDPARPAALPSRRLPVDLLLAGAALLFTVTATPELSVRPPLDGAPHPGTLPSEVPPTPPPGAAPSSLPAEPVAQGGELRLATSVQVRTLDPALAYDEAALMMDELLFARLLTWDDEGRLTPDLATRVEVQEGGRRYLFHLRHGVRFHDGAELRAVDVQRSIERTLHPRTASPAASHYAMIQGFAEFHAGRAPHLAGVRADDAHTVAINLDAPDATFLPRMTLAFMAPVCPSMGDVAEAANPVLPCGAGPFKLVRWDRDTAVHFNRHEGYFRPGLPHLDAVTWYTGIRATTQRYLFEEGKIDLLRELTPADTARYQNDPAWAGRGRWVISPRINAVFLNTELPPFDRPAMRRAVAHAVDPAVLERLRPNIVAADRVLPPALPGPPRDVPMRQHDLARALADMAEAGYPFDPHTGRGGYPHPIDYLAVPDSFEQTVGEVLQQQLARAGIRLRLRLVSFATYLAEVSRRGAVTMGFAGWQADFPDPSSFFEPTLSSEAIHDEGSQNYAFFRHAGFDHVLAAARVEQDPARRMAAYLRAEEIVRDEAPWVPLYTSRIFELWPPYLRGYARSPVAPPRLDEVWLAPTPAPSAAPSSGSPPR
ncbi:ABC transporter substrate-binding protein [Chondromyces apiculatus]|uniref:Oligopeptide transport system permease protein OppC n=1 Tax=Chondromyces apiculatus DSM 436 TaxID=1192034 RepID=A0A017TG48_9BACT|nr:ABC transporter substrate-binding protein [Chondromyces apiculatus]EYF07805.1 Oligopeptide transport system permease protein OppC [Chondromyces apiculatus DSM 436]